MTATTYIRDVTIVPSLHADGCFAVCPVWANVDRPNIGGWEVKGRRLAERLEKALRAGAVYGPGPHPVLRDVNGRTYADPYQLRVLGRRLNADLRRLGY